MDRNTILGLLLIFVILIGYSLWISPSKEELAKQQHIRDSLEQVAVQKALEQQARQEAPPKRIEENIPSKITDTAAVEGALPFNQLGDFAWATQGEYKPVKVKTDRMDVTVDNLGGRLSRVQLLEFQTYDSLPLVLFTRDSSRFNMTFFSNNRSINTGQLFFQPFVNGKPFQGDVLEVSGNDSLVLAMRMSPAQIGTPEAKQHFIEYVYTFAGNSYMVDFDIYMVGMDRYIAENASYLDLEWSAKLNRHDKPLSNTGNGASVYYKFYNDDVDHLSERDDEDEESLSTRLKWIAFKQRFFSSVLISHDGFDNGVVSVSKDAEKPGEENPHYLKNMKAEIGLSYQPSRKTSYDLQFYFGPNKYNILRKYDLDLEELIPLGWGILGWINRFAVIPVFNLLENFNINYGIIILILTILLKLVLFPIAYKTYQSQARMRVLKPEIDEINKKFPKKEDAMKKQQATMALYKKAGVNPAAGCVPMLLQFPILIAMFRFFPASFELRQQSFLWATDLSSYDSVLSLPFEIPFYGDHVSLFTLLMTISTIFYTKLNSEMMGSSSQQMPGMKTMMYLTPVMLLFFLNNYAAALSYYYLLANLITFAQMYFIRRFIDEDKIRKRIAMNKKKPVKKSKWQQRMEEMARQQQAQRRKK
jgi:YidC/Oxa1 family membrane protein insertase